MTKLHAAASAYDRPITAETSLGSLHEIISGSFSEKQLFTPVSLTHFPGVQEITVWPLWPNLVEAYNGRC